MMGTSTFNPQHIASPTTLRRRNTSSSSLNNGWDLTVDQQRRHQTTSYQVHQSSDEEEDYIFGGYKDLKKSPISSPASARARTPSAPKSFKQQLQDKQQALWALPKLKSDAPTIPSSVSTPTTFTSAAVSAAASATATATAAASVIGTTFTAAATTAASAAATATYTTKTKQYPRTKSFDSVSPPTTTTTSSIMANVVPTWFGSLRCLTFSLHPSSRGVFSPLSAEPESALPGLAGLDDEEESEEEQQLKKPYKDDDDDNDNKIDNDTQEYDPYGPSSERHNNNNSFSQEDETDGSEADLPEMVESSWSAVAARRRGLRYSALVDQSAPVAVQAEQLQAHAQAASTLTATLTSWWYSGSAAATPTTSAVGGGTTIEEKENKGRPVKRNSGSAPMII